MHRLNGSGPFWLNLLILAGAIIIVIIGDYKTAETERLIEHLSVELGIIAFQTWKVLRARKIFFDDKNLYLKHFFDKTRIEIVPLRDVTTFEPTLVRSGAIHKYKLAYKLNGQIVKRTFYPKEKYKFMFHHLVLNNQPWGKDLQQDDSFDIFDHL